MAVIVVNNEATRNYGRKVGLTNGMLVIHRDSNKNIIGTYLVTSFRNNKYNTKWQITTGYCSLINLETGYIAFEEPCSRNTTELRILRHLCRCCENAGTPKFSYNDSKISGSYIDEYTDFEMSITTK